MSAAVAWSEEAFDWKAPDYLPIIAERARRLRYLRAHPEQLRLLKVYYKDHPWDFINDWGCTYDPRNVPRGLPAFLPFKLFPRQRDWLLYTYRKWKAGERALTEKSRDAGVTWLAVALACTLCLFEDGMSVGFGSRKFEYVDKLGDMKAILPKARMFMRSLPVEFRAGYVEKHNSSEGKLTFPDTGAAITGEGGDSIGRGDRQALYFVDEAAHLARPDEAEASLSNTTDARHDISSVRGMANRFATNRWSGNIEVFIFDWREDPRKDQAWYDKKVLELDPVVVAQEIDRDYTASVEGVLIPAAWVRSAIDAHTVLKMDVSGA